MTPRNTLLITLAFSLLVLSACHRRARPVQSVSVTAGGHQSVTISHRHYRNLLRVASRDMRCQGRELAPQEVSPGIFSVSGCGQLRDYVMICTHRRHCRWVGIQPVEHVAMYETQCQTGQIVVQAPGPLSRQVSACGQELTYGLACGAAGCVWTRGAMPTAVMMQSEPGTSVIVVADEGNAPVVQTEPQETVATIPAGTDDTADVVQIDAAGTLQSLLMTQLAALRACTNGATVTLHVRWSASGQVSVGLGAPHTGTSVEACVQQAFGSFVLQGASAPGDVQVTL
jgi:hypothetical protein